MSFINPTSGKSAEYAPWQVNPYLWCQHGCRYCYGPNTLRRDPVEYYQQYKEKKNWQFDLARDAEKHPKDETVLLSFIGDPYQPVETERCYTREIIEVLIIHNVTFTVLTKGGRRALRDFDLLQRYERCSFGTTMVFCHEHSAKWHEPLAAPLREREEVLQEAWERHIKTWVSLEPVIFPRQALRVVERLHDIVDHWKIGKLNTEGKANAPDFYKRIERETDWKSFRGEAKTLLDSLHADYYFKDSLYRGGLWSEGSKWKF